MARQSKGSSACFDSCCGVGSMSARWGFSEGLVSPRAACRAAAIIKRRKTIAIRNCLARIRTTDIFSRHCGAPICIDGHFTPTSTRIQREAFARLSGMTHAARASSISLPAIWRVGSMAFPFPEPDTIWYNYAALDRLADGSFTSQGEVQACAPRKATFS